MNIDLGLRCPSCGTVALADDAFCESCGAHIAAARDVVRDHVEVDAGIAAGVTDRGLVHDRNDDAMFVGVRGAGVVAVVCDGVSSSAAPQIAAQLAAQVIGDELTTMLGRSSRDAAELAIRAGDERVRELAWTPSPGRTGPSCTVVAATWDDGIVGVAWAGDSRAYWCSASEVRQLTVDHSWAQEQLDAGVDVDPGDRRSHAITRWLGDDGLDDVATSSFRPTEPGRLVLCSDGLWNLVPAAGELAAVIRAHVTSPAIVLARTLVAMAVDRGGNDNVTVVVVDVDPLDATTIPPATGGGTS